MKNNDVTHLRTNPCGTPALLAPFFEVFFLA